MDKKSITKEYETDQITVVWKPGLCIHSGECVKRLPEVYRPDEKPWIKVDNASAEALRSQIETCPSGALSYKMKGKTITSMAQGIQINVTQNGPLLVSGEIEILNHDGTVEKKDKTTALCRCGASSNKPYCDGEHRKIQFIG